MSGGKELCVQIADPLTQRIQDIEDSMEIYTFFKPLFKLYHSIAHASLWSAILSGTWDFGRINFLLSERIRAIRDVLRSTQ